MITLAAFALLASAPSLPLANAIDNPSFEIAADGPDWRWQAGGTTNLTLVGDPSDPYSPEYSTYELANDPGPTTVSAHTGTHAFDFQIGKDPTGGYYHAFSNGSHGTLRQTLSRLIPGSAVAEASVWGKAAGETIRVQINYGDPFKIPFDQRPPTTASHNFKLVRGGWEKWNFTEAIDPTRKISSIAFSIDTFPKGQRALLDDVALIYYPRS